MPCLAIGSTLRALLAGTGAQTVDPAPRLIIYCCLLQRQTHDTKHRCLLCYDVSQLLTRLSETSMDHAWIDHLSHTLTSGMRSWHCGLHDMLLILCSDPGALLQPPDMKPGASASCGTSNGGLSVQLHMMETAVGNIDMQPTLSHDCASERADFCADVQPGMSRVYNCLIAKAGLVRPPGRLCDDCCRQPSMWDALHTAPLFAA